MEKLQSLLEIVFLFIFSMKVMELSLSYLPHCGLAETRLVHDTLKTNVNHARVLPVPGWKIITWKDL